VFFLFIYFFFDLLMYLLLIFVLLFIHRHLSCSTIPNSEPVGFQFLGLGSGDTKMHAPKTGTVLEPSWKLAGTLLKALLEP